MNIYSDNVVIDINYWAYPLLWLKKGLILLHYSRTIDGRDLVTPVCVQFTRVEPWICRQLLNYLAVMLFFIKWFFQVFCVYRWALVIVMIVIARLKMFCTKWRFVLNKMFHRNIKRYLSTRVNFAKDFKVNQFVTNTVSCIQVDFFFMSKMFIYHSIIQTNQML